MKEKITQLLIVRTKSHLAKTAPKIVAVVGSIGKTTVTQATAKLLSEKYDVKATQTNYNTDIGVILTIFDEEIKTNPVSWVLTIAKIVLKSFGKPKHDVYVLELGTDKPGDIQRFSYLNPDYAFVTAIAPEHMEFFRDIDAVAKEELTITTFTKKTFISAEVLEKYIASYAKGEFVRVGQNDNTKIINEVINTNGIDVGFMLYGEVISFHSELIASHLIKGLLAPALLAKEMGLTNEQIAEGLGKVIPLPGRMQMLEGINGSIIIDDTYNASPEAVKAALQTLYSLSGNKKIALLGMMNELGTESERMHVEIGEFCDPSKLNLIVTLGKDADAYIAPSATKRGCKVIMAKSAIDAADILKSEMEEGTVLLAKGSQNGVFAEETVKLLLNNTSDTSKLVRQSSYWPNKKKKYFDSLVGQ